MRFDWQAFCRNHHIEFVTSGPNTAKGNISIKCPFCGNADESQHMGLKLDLRDPQWGCFRNSRHRGTSPPYLVAKLLNIQYKHAVALCEAGAAPIDEFEAALEGLQNAPEPRQLGAAKKRPLTMPKEFRPLAGAGYKADMFLLYLSDIRGFGRDAGHVATEWGLHYALSGEQAYRVIFPVHAADGTLAGWTGRSIATSPVRYLAMENMGKNVIYAHPHTGNFTNRRALLIVEGPMDALKLNAFGGGAVRAIATMGTSITDGQLAAIVALRSYFTKMVVISDRTALAEGLALADQLSTYCRQEIHAVQLPGKYKDPGEMPGFAIKSFCSELIK